MSLKQMIRQGKAKRVEGRTGTKAARKMPLKDKPKNSNPARVAQTRKGERDTRIKSPAGSIRELFGK